MSRGVLLSPSPPYTRTPPENHIHPVLPGKDQPRQPEPTSICSCLHVPSAPQPVTLSARGASVYLLRAPLPPSSRPTWPCCHHLLLGTSCPEPQPSRWADVSQTGFEWGRALISGWWAELCCLPTARCAGWGSEGLPSPAPATQPQFCHLLTGLRVEPSVCP